MLQSISQGSYGKVYKTEHKGKNYAIKSPKATKNFGITELREIDIAVRFRHPYVAQLLNVKENKQKYTFVFPLADGTIITLSKELEEELEYVKYIVQLLLGLDYVHKRGIILMDIKPANILYFRDDDSLRFNDFGVSLYNDPVFTNESGGTPIYMSPEVLIENNAVPKSDVWSLGLTLLEVITGVNPQDKVFDKLEEQKISYSKIPYKDEYITLYKKLLDEYIMETLKKINNTNLMTTLHGMLTINVKDRFSIDEILSMPWLKRFKRYAKLIEKTFVGCPIITNYVNSYNLKQNFPIMQNFLKNVSKKDEGVKWAIINAVDIVNYLITTNNTEDDITTAAIALLLSLKIYSHSYEDLSYFISLLPQSTKLNKKELLKYEEKILKILNYKVYRKNIFSFLLELKVKIDDFNKLFIYVTETEFSGELPEYAYIFLEENKLHVRKVLFNAVHNV